MKYLSTTLKYLFIITLMGLAILGYLRRQWLYDQFVIYSYEGSASIVELGEKAGLSHHGLSVFLQSDPEIVDYQTLTEKCPEGSEGETELIFGCFFSDNGSQYRIYLLDIEEPEIKDYQLAVLVHEVLHFEYQLQSDSEKLTLDNELNDFWTSLDPDYRDQRFLGYSDLPEQDQHRELYAIAGSELEDAQYQAYPVILESYQEILDNREGIVDASRQFDRIFRPILDQINTLASDLDQSSILLEARYQDLTTQNAELERLLAGGQITDYNSRVAGYNDQVDRYNALADQHNTQLAELEDKYQIYFGIFDDIKAGKEVRDISS